MAEDESIIYSIVVPCYRSEQSLPELVKRVQATLQPRGEPFEIILVNDASPDGTWQVIERLAQEHPCVVGLDMLRNGGQYRALLCGLEHVRGQRVILMDDDLQHPPEQIPVLIEALRSRPQVDCVMGKYRVKYHSWVRNLGSAMVSRLDSVLYGKPRQLVGSSFQIMTRQLADALTRHRTVNPIVIPLIYRTTRRVENVAVEHEPRSYGESGYQLRSLVRLVFDNVLSASNLPLRMVSALGLISALGSLVLGIYYLVAYLTDGFTVAGFATQVLLIIFFGGMTLLSIGLVGEYLVRILDEVRGGPRFVVRTQVGPDGRDSGTTGNSARRGGNPPR